jgi:hypothetical protein
MSLAQALLASASRTTTQTSADLDTMGAKALVVTLDVTLAGTGSIITLSILRKDWASGKYTTILAGLAVTANGTTVYKVSPLVAAVANLVANDLLPQTIQIVVTANNANPVTYSVGYDLIKG